MQFSAVRDARTRAGAGAAYRGPMTLHHVRLAGRSDCRAAADLLHDFNREFDAPTPGPEVLTARLARLLDGGETFAYLAGTPAIGIALVTLRPNVWFDGPVALLDELYVRPDHRGRTIGTDLVGAVADHCRGIGVDFLEVNVDEGDADAPP